jgi:hypothetical protein
VDLAMAAKLIIAIYTLIPRNGHYFFAEFPTFILSDPNEEPASLSANGVMFQDGSFPFK